MPAPKGNQNALGNPGGGRNTLYKDEYVEWAEKLAKLGAKDSELADAFEVSETTINTWKREHVEFSEALKRGKVFADANVASALYHRAMGYSHPAVKFMQVGGEIVEKEYIEHYPPDATSMIFWLKNRQPQKWRDRREAAPEDDTAPLDDPNEGV